MVVRTVGCRRAVRGLFVLLVAAAFSGCATPSVQTSDKLKRGTSELRVLLMPLDVELSEITAGGIKEPKAEWTALAETHITTHVTAELRQRNARLVPYVAPAAGSDRAKAHLQLVKLHGAVGASIVMHRYFPMLNLPTKKDKFDWALGPDVARLNREYGADYAMFIYLRDSYASGGRAAAMVIAAVLAGVVPPGGSQVGFASLVDLRTGEIVWFNLLARAEGDLRTSEAAEESVKALLNNLPK